MKKLILLLLVLTFVSCTKNAENQAKENIEKYIMAKLDDPKSYESVSFGKLEKTKTTVKDDAKYKLLLLELDEIDKKTQSAFDLAMSMTHAETIRAATESFNRLDAMGKSTIAEIKKFENKYKPIDIYKIKHTYKAKNKMGALVLDSCIVVLDTVMNVSSVQ